MKKMLLLIMLFTFATTYSISAAERTLTVHHVDQYGVPIDAPEIFVEEEGTLVTLYAKTNNHFSVNAPGATYPYTFTADDEQTFTFTYNNHRMFAPQSYFSMFFNTSYTYTGFVGAEYGGNIGYFDSVDDEHIRSVYTSSFGYTTTANKSIIFEVTFPEDQKFSLTTMMAPRLFVNNSGNQVLPLEMLDPSYTDGQLDLVDEGIEYDYWASLDNKQSYLPFDQLTEAQKSQVTNVVGRIFFTNNINYSGQRLFLTADLPISLNKDNLSESELNGTTAIEGWKYRTPDFPSLVNLNTKTFLLNPMISGVVKTNTEKDWDSGTLYQNALVELIEVDENNAETIIATTQTLADGTFSFHKQITSFNNIKIKITNGDYSSYFYYLDSESNPSYLATNNVAIGNLPEMLTQTDQSIYSWFSEPNTNSFAQQSRSLNFLLVDTDDDNEIISPEPKPDPKPKPEPKPDPIDKPQPLPDAGQNILSNVMLMLCGLLFVGSYLLMKRKAEIVPVDLENN